MQDNNKRSLEDPKAKEILNVIRVFQKKSADAWFEVKVNELKLKDYLAGKEFRTELEYTNEASGYYEKLNK